MYAVSGTLNHEAGGPGVCPPLPPEMINTLLSGQWKTSPRTADHYRRSIYIFARRNLRYPLFATFDRPAANASCAARLPSTTAVQSLLLFNSNTTMAAAERLAQETDRVAPDSPAQQCDEIYRRLFSHAPDEIELSNCVAFLRDQSALLEREGRENVEFLALTDLCRALLNSNEFIYVD